MPDHLRSVLLSLLLVAAAIVHAQFVFHFANGTMSYSFDYKGASGPSQ